MRLVDWRVMTNERRGCEPSRFAAPPVARAGGSSAGEGLLTRFVAEFPTTGVGKISRRELRRALADRLRHQDEARKNDFHILLKPVVPNKLRSIVAFKLGMRPGG